ncbi:cation:proton antiporter [Geomonas oryzae]|uniref:cation:proton antiporter n=1 Tax=Geomonas oryzae TaxID=2364273 RepID=UPI00100A23DB|nr:sodium:proton antiporter [Geomonas oryzae]
MRGFQITALLTTLTATFAYLNHRFLKLPPTVGLMLLSLLFSLLLWSSIAVGVDVVTPARQLMDRIDFDVLFLQGILSLLLFAGALFVKVEELLNVKLSIALFSVAGVLVSAGVIGGGFYLLALLLGLPVRLEYALLFGAIMSPTDPVAVLPTLRRLGIPDRLNAWIAGEALFNDGIGIVLFLALHAAAVNASAPGVMSVLRTFVIQTAGGLAFGSLLGWLGFLLIKSIDNYRLEILITLALVLGGYSLALLIGVSGPLSMVVAGLFIGGRGRKLAMSEHTRMHLDQFWDLVEKYLNAILFTLIGLELLVLSDRLSLIHLGTGLLVIPVVLLGRFLSVLAVGGLVRMREPFSLKDASIMTWSGLRGAIAIALAMSLPQSEGLHILLVTTYIVVLFSILVQGPTLGLLLAQTSSEGGGSHE